MVDSKFMYNRGFDAYVCSEALPNALPKGQNNPQKCPYGLYAEQLSGTAFTKSRAKNKRTWLYRGRPSPANEWGHGYNMKSCDESVNWIKKVPLDEHTESKPEQPKRIKLVQHASEEFQVDPNQLRWSPLAIPEDTPLTFLQGIATVAKTGNECTKEGLAIHTYVCNKSMIDTCFSDSDGDLLIVPQIGNLLITTEFGKIELEPNEICVVQRGMKFLVEMLPDADGKTLARGYILEIFSGHFELPELGPIGSNGLANPRDFLTPTASYDPTFPTERTFLVINKFGGEMFSYEQNHTPFDVVAFHGNYLPYKYDLRKFCCMNSVTYDHPDPSIYTVLTCPSNEPGVAVADFVVFPPRWCVMENSFRPPWFHRNTMSEYMGMIWGKYDAKTDGEGGFVPGGASLHQCMTPHGPDAETFENASNEKLTPKFFDQGLAFMFETTYLLRLSKFARFGSHRQLEYQRCWSSLKCNFDPNYDPMKDGSSADNVLEWRKESKTNTVNGSP
uniref:homogentisate 1,2-dioxygenase n=1 Tax=Aplanochytrium stocchinoi TaxID=215587 RepID=A0A7S3PH04_9STRA|mmetsp:Transcript_16632/g.19937  ORF Transcript_16632/g.19937 Transcript_16632/m.19937 type:complete len:502 (+) Transcript_16632:170-1675(+)|eukprot:CAMPEP_0204833884 /NCGR_PEP_ID=MMETSP1346-20131115/18069_1 /ASSEMBLY_ACC=CAM_ASM_000771 /TAXON_ID=215587 /ORGANISM="Aplanochytrium stocchinoi, Strain GSBS06" /LENGTH=501 /DNA_ID=CAMNT_0051966737 /DNA_START=106 /DNA_END=1611 /DNA_ORIENTATION=-